MKLQSLFPSLQKRGVILVAVTKTFSSDTVKQAYDLGVRHFGENRVEEAKQKIAQVKSITPDAIWHMVGHVQSKKATVVAEFFDWVDSVDSLKLAKKLNEAASIFHKKLNILIQVNLSGEAQKYGCDVRDLDELLEECTHLPNISVLGLMIMPPLVASPEENREIFKRAKKLFDTHPHLQHLSMGTSQDYQVAIEEGATMVRLGTALFGERVVK